MNTVKLLNYDAYKTSKSDEVVHISGDFEVSSKVLNGRTKITEQGTNNVYWIKSLIGFTEITPSIVDKVDVEEILEEQPVKKTTYYTVQRGDGVQSIATKLGLPVSTVISRVGGTTVTVGQKIIM